MNKMTQEMLTYRNWRLLVTLLFCTAMLGLSFYYIYKGFFAGLPLDDPAVKHRVRALFLLPLVLFGLVPALIRWCRPGPAFLLDEEGIIGLSLSRNHKTLWESVCSITVVDTGWSARRLHFGLKDGSEARIQSAYFTPRQFQCFLAVIEDKAMHRNIPVMHDER
ncbi:hypothetical protein [Gimibacter soli]|uniref:PH domain-containing protein n=1 Tax=Gimibacter soli TaxID=3024400 RepID=A0AAE9XQV8_9PROT|nr:hypothetical protein [Gimibacter soli]WCL55527.1 hypothetical protein PH603_07105 [Gimibacter soli]